MFDVIIGTVLAVVLLAVFIAVVLITRFLRSQQTKALNRLRNELKKRTRKKDLTKMKYLTNIRLSQLEKSEASDSSDRNLNKYEEPRYYEIAVDSQNEIYYNVDFDNKNITQTFVKDSRYSAVPVTGLQDHVTTADGIHVIAEYNALPPINANNNKSDFITIRGLASSKYTCINSAKSTEHEVQVYFATKDPTTDTVEHFWEIIWQQDVRLIVMITDCADDLHAEKKPYDYWRAKSDTEDELYANVNSSEFEITLKEETHHAHVTVRRLCLEHKREKNQNRSIHQLQLRDFCTTGEPAQPTHLLAVRRKADDIITREGGTVLVHTSDDMHAAGAYIVIDSLITEMCETQQASVYSYVCDVRLTDGTMITTLEQYQYVYRALLEEYFSKDTVISVDDLDKLTESESSQDLYEDLSTSKLQEQYQSLVLLASLSDAKDQQAAAMLDVNKTLRRDPHIYPCERVRPLLNISPSNPTGYIHAAFVDSYTHSRAYIVTQMPLTHTVDAFWSMVYQYQVHTIVTLEKDLIFPVYYPEQDGAPLNGSELTVTCLSVYSHNIQCVKFREFEITKADVDGALKVKQLQITSWPAGWPTPDNVMTLLEVIDYVHKQQTADSIAPVVVQCSNGAERSGLFCVVSHVIQCLQQQQQQHIDVFSAARHVRCSWPHAITCEEQYNMVHRIIKTYITDYREYANVEYS